ncbi:hypothetical protein DFJ63DRAFT_313840 [Scheffersomyces coipomensis]|uniref:uncharacterized protein n=1 Tax=Scheffersomyces coipomensis TaxID=1788519 RepID=UPI00315D21CE
MKRSNSDSLTLYSYQPCSTSITSISTTSNNININNNNNNNTIPTSTNSPPINKSLKRVKLEHEIFSTSIKDIELMFNPITIIDHQSLQKDQYKFNFNYKSSSQPKVLPTHNIINNNNSTNNMIVPKYTTMARSSNVNTVHDNSTILNALKYDCINLSLLSSISSASISDEEEEEEDEEEEEEEEEEFDEDDDDQFIDNTKVAIPILPSQTKSVNNSLNNSLWQQSNIHNHSVAQLINFELNYLPLEMTGDDLYDDEDEVNDVSLRRDLIRLRKFSLESDLNRIDEMILLNH